MNYTGSCRTGSSVQSAEVFSQRGGPVRRSSPVRKLASTGFCCSHSTHNVTLRRIQNLNGFFYRIFLFTLRAQRDVPTYTKLEWLFYRIFLFTLRAQHDAPTYTKTTDQCGARSGSPQSDFFVHTPRTA